MRDRIKENIDASVRENLGTGMGVVFRGHNEKPIATGTRFFPFAYEPEIAEAMAFRWSLTMARDLGFNDLEVETDCLSLFQVWKRSSPHNNYLASIVQDCKTISSSFNYCLLLNCSRTVNVVADHIAKLAFDYRDHVWEGLDPPRTSLLLRQEASFCTGNEVSIS